MKKRKKEEKKGTKPKPKRSSFKTFTKTWVSRLMYIAVFDIQLSYLLAFLGKEQIAETLSITVVTEIIGVMSVYFIKSFLETRESERIRVQEETMETYTTEESEEET